MRKLIGLLLLGTLAVWGQDSRLPAGTYNHTVKHEHDSNYQDVVVKPDHSMSWTEGESSMDSNSQTASGTWSLRATKNGNWLGTFHVQTLTWNGYRPPDAPEHPKELSMFGHTVHPGDEFDFMMVAEEGGKHFQFTTFDKAQKPTFTVDLVKSSR